MKYENYIFDLYGTLVDIHTDEEMPMLWEKLALFYGYYDAIYTPEELKTRYSELVTERESAEQGEDDVHEAHPEIKIEQVFQALFREKGVDADMTLAVHAGQFFRILSTEYIRIYDGVKQMLAMLKDAGKKIYLLSNAQRIFTEYEMHTLGIAEYFDDIFISSECGVKKPDERFFRLLMDKHQLKTESCVMIGNDLSNDIGGARQIGLDAFYIHSNISPKLPRDEKTQQEIKPEAEYVLMQMDMEKVMDILRETM